MAKDCYHRPPIARMAFISCMLQARTPFTANAVADKLEVSRKTIERDIQFMRDRLNYEIEWDGTAFGYFGRPPKERVL